MQQSRPSARGPRMMWVEETSFESGGMRCVGAFYRPVEAELPGALVPCMVLGHGTDADGTRDVDLDRYARAFAAAGMAALTFEHRHYGDSDGEPGQLSQARCQQDDYRAAIAHARRLPGVDPERVAVWDTALSALSAGHVRAGTTVTRTSGHEALARWAPGMDGESPNSRRR